MIDLTICIPTVPGRESLLSRLLWTLQPQLSDRVEVLVSPGRRPMGDKLNEMFAAARGTYVVAIDDDDLVTSDYVATITQLAEHDLDFIGHDILWLEDGRYAGRVRHRIGGDTSWRSLDRGVSPKCPVRTDIARRVRFGNEYTADRAWSAAAHEQCESGTYLARCLYIYDHWSDHMVGTSPDDPRYGRPQRDVGIWPFDREAFTWLA
jgi:hypothetical protein